MSLLSDSFEEMTMYDATTSPDGVGGFTREWKKGATFSGVAVFDSSLQGRRAEKEGVTSLYTVTTKRTTILQYHDVFKRERDGKVFRVTSDGDDKYTPASASLDMRQVTAEEWEMT